MSSALDNRKDKESFLLDEVNLGSFTALPGMMVFPLTRAEWLVGIPVGGDLPRNYKHLTEAEKNQVSDRRAEWEHIHGSLGALGTVDDEVGKSGKEEVALVAEPRRMKEYVPTADLQPIALAAFDWSSVSTRESP